jgi:hypothetical protein
MGGVFDTDERDEQCTKIFYSENPKGRDPFGRPRHEYKANIKIDFNGIRCVWAGLTWLRVRTD